MNLTAKTVTIYAGMITAVLAAGAAWTQSPLVPATKGYVLAQNSGIEKRIIGLQIYQTKTDLKNTQREIKEWEEVEHSATDARAKAKAVDRVNELKAEHDELDKSLNLFKQQYDSK